MPKDWLTNTAEDAANKRGEETKETMDNIDFESRRKNLLSQISSYSEEIRNAKPWDYYKESLYLECAARELRILNYAERGTRTGDIDGEKWRKKYFDKYVAKSSEEIQDPEYNI